jgi:hypothetical protein
MPATGALAMDTIMGQSDEDEDNLSALLISAQVSTSLDFPVTCLRFKQITICGYISGVQNV